jgi:hypothetical protein
VSEEARWTTRPTRTDAEGSREHGLTRRTWVRNAANAAWSVPLVSVATAAPARAAASGLDALEVSATFYTFANGRRFCVDPVITVTNPTARATGVLTVDLLFSTSDFIGTNTFRTPPTPSYIDLPIPSWDTDWQVATQPANQGDAVVTVRLTKTLGLAANMTSTVGGAVNTCCPFGIQFANDPVVTEVPLQVAAGAPGFSVTSAKMTKVKTPF